MPIGHLAWGFKAARGVPAVWVLARLLLLAAAISGKREGVRFKPLLIISQRSGGERGWGSEKEWEINRVRDARKPRSRRRPGNRAASNLLIFASNPSCF